MAREGDVPRVIATVECRMSSTRLPGKNLLPIIGRPMVRRLLERLSRSRRLDLVCLATSTDPEDDVLEDVARSEGVAWHRGSLDDVLDRTLSAARSFDADVIVEITGDCPLIDPGITDAVIARYLNGSHDYVTNILDRLTFPIGFDIQVYSTDLLQEVASLTNDAYDRNNVTPFIYRNPQRYRLLNVSAPPDLDRPGYRLCVDHPEDLEVIREVYGSLYPESEAFDARSIVRLLDRAPDLVARNTWRPDSFEFPTSGGAADQEALSIDG